MKLSKQTHTLKQTRLPQQFLQEAVDHFQVALARLPDLLGDNFLSALELIEKTSGHIICSGMGKSGLIAQKIAATLSSTGTPSFFLHPSEALHGDLGAVTKHDTLILISNSGETSELLSLLPSLKNFGNPYIAMTGREGSTLDKQAEITLPITVDRELCPNNLAPTTSTLMTLATGDLIAVALMQKRGFDSQDFARYHPAGSLGRKLLMQVKDTMIRTPLPCITPDTLISEAMLIMTEGRLGLALIFDQKNKLKGLLSDGDIRRAMLTGRTAIDRPCKDFMTKKPITIHESTSLSEADNIMLENKIKFLIATDDQKDVVGVVEFYST